MLIKLFLMFVKLSMFSFGGGYVMIPIMLQELEKNAWASAADVADVVAIAGMCPGPVAVNASVGIGYKVAGIKGVIAAFLGVALPCAIIVILVATFFFKVYKNPNVQYALYGLRPVITGIIFYASVKLALKNGMLFSAKNTLLSNGYNIMLKGQHLFEVKSILLALTSFILLTKTKIHPIVIIIGSGILGYILF